jgi:YVTN family beta-propeller protein
VVDRPIKVGDDLTGVAMSRDGQRLYVASDGPETVSVIDTSINWPLPVSIKVGWNPSSVAVSPDGRRVYVANNGSGTVSVIDTGRNRVK